MSMRWYEKTQIEAIAQNIVSSYNRYIRSALQTHSGSIPLVYDHEWALPPSQRVASFLYSYKYPLLFHDGVPSSLQDTGKEPRFQFANKEALLLFDYMDEDDLLPTDRGKGIDNGNLVGGLIGVPSRLSAEPMEQSKRHEFLASVGRDGYTLGYEGVRIGRTGRRFYVKDVMVWNIHDSEKNDEVIGQAALLPTHKFL